MKDSRYSLKLLSYQKLYGKFTIFLETTKLSKNIWKIHDTPWITRFLSISCNIHDIPCNKQIIYNSVVRFHDWFYSSFLRMGRRCINQKGNIFCKKEIIWRTYKCCMSNTSRGHWNSVFGTGCATTATR